MFISKPLLLLTCMLSLTGAKKKEAGDGAIRVVVRGPPLPLLMEHLSNMMMNQYLKSIPQTSDSRSDFRPAPFHPGPPNGYDGPYGGGAYGMGPHFPPLPRRFAPTGSSAYYNPKRTGYNLGLGLGALKGLLIGTGSSALQQLGERSSGGRGYRMHHHPGSYDVFKSLIPKFNIQDGLLLLKGLIKGSKASKREGFSVGQRLGTLKLEMEEKAEGVKDLVKKYYAKPYAGSYYGNGY